MAPKGKPPEDRPDYSVFAWSWLCRIPRNDNVLSPGATVKEGLSRTAALGITRPGLSSRIHYLPFLEVG
jgi:hypothetical protein